MTIELPFGFIRSWSPSAIAQVEEAIKTEHEETQGVGIGPVQALVWKRYKDFITKIPNNPSVHDLYEDLRITHAILRKMGLNWS